MKLGRSYRNIIFPVVAGILALSGGNFLSASPAGAAASSGEAGGKADWEQKWMATLAGARAEGKLTIYGSALGAGFRSIVAPKLKDNYGINLDIVSGAQAQMLSKITLEGQAGIHNVDMTLFSPTAYLDFLKPKNLVVPLAPHLILPTVKDNKSWLSGKLPMFDKEGTVMALTSTYFSYILVNTQVVKDEIHSYRDLLNPKWKGKIVMFDPAGGPGPGETFVNFFIPRIMGVEGGEKYLKDLAKQDIVYVRDQRQLAEWVAKEKYPVGIAVTTTIVGDFVKSGAPIAFVRPQEGGLMAVAASCLAIVNKAPHANAAAVFLNWVLTDEGQRLFAEAYNAPPRRLGVPYLGSDQFGIVRPKDKTVEADEAFYVNGRKTAHFAKEIFGPVINK